MDETAIIPSSSQSKAYDDLIGLIADAPANLLNCIFPVSGQSGCCGNMQDLGSSLEDVRVREEEHQTFHRKEGSRGRAET